MKKLMFCLLVSFVNCSFASESLSSESREYISFDYPTVSSDDLSFTYSLNTDLERGVGPSDLEENYCRRICLKRVFPPFCCFISGSIGLVLYYSGLIS